jgi:tRNA modification GTPase
VGKSSLLNALAGYERAIVHDRPGTTRDLVVARIACDGWPVNLCDTAGLRPSADPIESLGVERARESQLDADLVLVLLDGSQPLSPLDHELLATHKNAWVVATKSDLPWVWRGQLAVGARVSALAGEGVDALASVIGARLVPHAPPGGAGVPFLAEQIACLQGAHDRMEAGDIAAAAELVRALREDGDSRPPAGLS